MKKNLLSTFVAATVSILVSAPSAQAAAPGAGDKIPTPDTPVLMIGDSMMRILGSTMEKQLKKAGVQPAAAFSSIGSGLVRPTIFDWTAKVAELLDEHHPKTVFVTLGANDRQALEAGESGVVQYGHPDWAVAYAERIGALMDQLIAGGATRVVWLLLPDMKDPVQQEHASLVNGIARAEAAVEARADKVTLFDLAPVLSRRPGKYTQYLMSPKGEALSVRDPDGIHLTGEGAKVVTAAILKEFWKK